MSAPRILVVDDEADISTILTVVLRRAGYEVSSAADGLEAIEAIRRQAPDLVLLDVMMPRADGLETLRRIREHGPTAQVPVIMLTAKAALADKMKGFERGADDYVAKPFEPAEILARVQILLKRTAQARLTAPLLGVLGEWSTAEGVAQLGRDLESAREIQMRLLPQVPSQLAGLEAAAALRPSAVVGGDFYDLVPMGDRVGVALGDVAGKGIPAALVMVMVRTLLREIARGLREPGEVLGWLNASLCRDMPPNMFVSLVLAVLDPTRPGHITLANAGHPAPLVMRRGAEPEPVTVAGPLLGVREDSVFDQTALEFVLGGDTLVLFTDGVVEPTEERGKRSGLTRLMELLDRERSRSAPELVQAITDDVFRRTARLPDDMALFVLRRP
ncbi:MAG TPA: SpoIIE family protein phosphatase [Methylomirabilota bacterium]|nr:SpoIIE family protein phosphatase [Methylomirabilota bacterium]